MHRSIRAWNHLKQISAVVLGSTILTPLAVADTAEIDTLAYVKNHCVRCHGAEEQNADRRFDTLVADLTEREIAEHWQEILDIVNLGEMPPKDEPQPSSEETRQFVAAVTRQLELARETLSGDQQQRFRRLNRQEYRNTIRDLLGVNIDSFDPTSSFPADDRVDGFDNLGEHLVLSDYLMQCYLEAASRSVDKAVKSRAVVEPINERLLPNDFSKRKFLFRPEVRFVVNPTGEYVDIAHTDPTHPRLYANRFKGVPADGYYRIRVKAEGIHRQHPYARSDLQVDVDEPIKMQVIATDPRGAQAGEKPNATDRVIATISLADHEATTYELRVWLDEGYVPVIRYANGPLDFRSSMVRLVKKHHPETKTSNWLDVFSSEPSEIPETWFSDAYQGPRVRVHQVEIIGPEPNDASKPDLLADMRVQSLEKFLSRAFRRPPMKSEIARYEAFYQSRLQAGETQASAFLTTCKAILCSPNFIYIETPPPADANDDKAFRLASRLSYFLWSSMPDDGLLQAAADGTLQDPNVLLAQTRRMLEDSKAEAFTVNFTNSWLHLNELGSMPPDPQKFAGYYDRQLEPLMRRETQLFFAEVLRKNLSIDHFIDSDFTFANRYLAAHYGLPMIAGDEFRRVALPEQSLRGGLLGHASVLTATSNGIETSPVTRGIWVLENILGTPPPPPPPDVEPLEPDIRGATTIREQLAKHRNVATCAECHRKIDPIGFALESFDPIGSVRHHYHNSDGEPINKLDTTGTLPSGEPFADIVELKQLLLKQKNKVAKCLTQKMLTYALGRELGFQDRPAVESIVDELAERGNGLSDLVEIVVTSDKFNDN